MINSGGALSLTAILEDAFSNSGNTVTEILASAGDDRITDPDAGAMEGIAVIDIDNSNGTWQYDANADGNWQAFGSVDNSSAVLLGSTSRIRFLPTADYSGTGGQIEFRAWDLTSNNIGNTEIDVSANGGEYAFSSATETASILVNAVNDPPQLTLPADQSVNEDTDLALTGIALGDVDAGAGSLQVTLSVNDGTLTFGDTSGLAFSSGDGTADASMTFTGTVTDLNAALATLSYRGNLDFHGTDTLSISVDDQNNTGLGGALSDSGSLNIDVQAVNDPPQLTLPADQSVNEDTDLALTGIALGDVDAGAGSLQVTLSVNDGTLTFGDTSGLAFSSGDGTADASMTFTGTVTDLNAALATLSYRGNLDFHGTDTLSISVNDQNNTGLGGALSDSGSLNIDVQAVNDPPTTVGIDDIVVNEDTPFTTVDLFAAFDDAEDLDDQLSYAVVDVSHPELFTHVFINQSQGLLVLRYAPNANGSSEITLVVQDSGGLTVTETFGVEVKAMNDAPVATAESYTVRGDEVLVANSPGILANDTDIDGDELSAIVVRQPRHGKLEWNPDGSFRYVPDPSFVGNDTFSYVATDGDAVSGRVSVVIKVVAPGSPIDTTPGNDTAPSTPSGPRTIDPSSQLSLLVNAELPDAILESEASSQLRIRQRGLLTADQTSGEEDLSQLSSIASLNAGSDDLSGARASSRTRYGEEFMESSDGPVEVPAAAATVTTDEALTMTVWEDLGDLNDLLKDDRLFHQILIDSAFSAATGLTVWYVLWTVRAGYLLTSLIAQMPAWRMIDPLPILETTNADYLNADGESLESILQSGHADSAPV